MNKAEFLEIADLIEKAKPTNFHMGSWFGKMTTMEYLQDYNPELFLELEEYYNYDDTVNVGYSYGTWSDAKNIMDPTFQDGLACDTTACIAGWTVFNDCVRNNHTQLPYSVETRAMEILEINTHEAQRLFYCGYDSIWDEVANQYEFDYDRDVPETWSFSNVMVASVLRRIANGDLSLED